MLWLQDKNREKVLSVQAVSTVWNTADLGTKSLSAERMNMLLFMIGTVDADSHDEPVGRKEFELEMEKQASKQQIRQICVQMCEPRETRPMTTVNVRMAKALLALHGFTMTVNAERLGSAPDGVCGLEDEHGGDYVFHVDVRGRCSVGNRCCVGVLEESCVLDGEQQQR